MDGISFPVAMIGLFAVSEMMKLAIKGTPIVDRSLVKEDSTVWQGIKDGFSHWWLVVRSRLLGLWIGVLPGVGASVAGLAAYAQACKPRRRRSVLARARSRG